jgi:hypothetical protein
MAVSGIAACRGGRPQGVQPVVIILFHSECVWVPEIINKTYLSVKTPTLCEPFEFEI